MGRDSFAPGRFKRSVGILAGGTAIAQALPLLALPIITRMYSPTDFALLAVFMAATQFISVGACLRLETAIPLPEKDSDAFAVLVLAIASATLVAGGLLALTLIYPSALAKLISVPGIEQFFWLIPVAVLSTSVCNALQFWTTRKQRYSTVAKTRIYQSVVATGTQIGVGALQTGPGGLILGSILQAGAGLASLARKIISSDGAIVRGFKVASLRSAWIKQKNFPKYSVVEAMAQIASLQIPIIMMASAVIGPEVGYLALAMKVMQAPTTLIGSAISQVYISNAPEVARREGLAGPGLYTVGAVMKYAAGPMIFGALVGEELFTFIFGEEWGRAGDLLLWLAPLFIVHLAAASIGGAFYIAGRQFEAMMIQIIGLVLRVAAVWASLYYAKSWVVEVYAISGFIFYSMYLSMALLRSGIRLNDFAREVLRSIPWIAGWCLTAWVVIVVESAISG